MGWWWWVDSGVCGVDEEFARSFGGVVRVALRCVALRCVALRGVVRYVLGAYAYAYAQKTIQNQTPRRRLKKEKKRAKKGNRRGVECCFFFFFLWFATSCLLDLVGRGGKGRGGREGKGRGGKGREGKGREGGEGRKKAIQKKERRKKQRLVYSNHSIIQISHNTVRCDQETRRKVFFYTTIAIHIYPYPKNKKSFSTTKYTYCNRAFRVSLVWANNIHTWQGGGRGGGGGGGGGGRGSVVLNNQRLIVLYLRV